MKSLKLLLASSAGVLAVTAAQAADLPVKAKPVEYVKVCSLYGAGFYYIPGTDTCLKIGGYVRAEWLHNASGSFAPWSNAGNGPNSTRFTYTDSNDLQSRVRGVYTFDARSQTEYGTLRSYFKGGLQWTSNDGITAGSGAVTYLERAFIQFAGFTFGRAQSFFDFFAYPVYSYQTSLLGSDTGGTGTNLIAYTAQLGNGVTATLSLEENLMRRKATPDTLAVVSILPNVLAAPGTALTTDNANGQSVPDIIGALRVDQTWGSAQLAVAAHQITGGYYNANTTNNPHPDREWGWAALAGLELNLPTGPGDKFAIAATWAEGALGYVFTGGVQNLSAYGTGGANGVAVGSFAFGPIADGIYGGAGAIGTAPFTEIETVAGWSVYAGLKHNWSPSLFSTLYGGYAATDWGTGARNLFCTSVGGTNGNLVASGCDPDSAFMQIGSLTQWTPVANFTVGLDIIYNKLETAQANNTGLAALGASGARQAGTYRIEDLDWWSGIFRVQRNFWP